MRRRKVDMQLMMLQMQLAGKPLLISANYLREGHMSKQITDAINFARLGSQSAQMMIDCDSINGNHSPEKIDDVMKRELRFLLKTFSVFKGELSFTHKRINEQKVKVTISAKARE